MNVSQAWRCVFKIPIPMMILVGVDGIPGRHWTEQPSVHNSEWWRPVTKGGKSEDRAWGFPLTSTSSPEDACLHPLSTCGTDVGTHVICRYNVIILTLP